MKKILQNKKIYNIIALILGISFYLFTIIKFQVNFSNLYDFLIFLEIPIILIIITNLKGISKKELKRNRYFILFIYLIFLLSLILINPIKGIILNGIKLYDYNLIPFKTIISSFNKDNLTLLSHFIMLIPLSILLPLINKNFKKTYLMLITLILISTTYRIIQYILLIGVFDIDEIILNVIGSYIIFLIIYKTKLKELFTFKLKDKTLNIIYIILFIMLIFLGSNRILAYLYQDKLVPEISGNITYSNQEEYIGIRDGYKYYTKCHGNYNIIFNNKKYTIKQFIELYPNIDKYMDKFELRREKYITDIIVNDNISSNKELVLKTPYNNIYYYNIQSIKVRIGDIEYDYKDYLNKNIDIEESLDLEYTFNNLGKFHSSKDNYTIDVGYYFNRLYCQDNIYLLPKNYQVLNNTCNYLDKLK